MRASKEEPCYVLYLPIVNCRLNRSQRHRLAVFELNTCSHDWNLETHHLNKSFEKFIRVTGQKYNISSEN